MLILKKFKFLIFIGWLSLVIGFSFWQLRPKKLNVLILSTCSLRANRLGYDSGKNTSPYIDEVAKNSFIFKNAFTDKSWSNVSGFLESIPPEFIREYGYSGIGDYDKTISANNTLERNGVDFYIRLPSHSLTAVSSVNQAGYVDLGDDLLKIKKRLQDRSNYPFYVEIHSKILHLPYGGLFDKNHPAVRYLISPKSVRYIQEYEANYLNYPDRLPFSFFLGNIDELHSPLVARALNIDPQQASKMFSGQKVPLFIGSLNNKNIIERWKNSQYFSKDLEIIKEIYDYRLKLYDESLKEIINLYDDKNLKDNTVIIFTGDHGEAFFEHGLMIHGETVFDEMLNFPLFIKFPGQTRGTQIDQQFFQGGIATIVKKIMSGELTKENFNETIRQKITFPFIYSRTCSNDLRSVRYNNEWKYIIDLKKDKKYLYDLKNDPGEMHDLFELRPDITSFLEENFIAQSSVLKSQSTSDQYCNGE